MIFKLGPSCGSVNSPCFIYIFRHCLKTGDIDNGIHGDGLPACYKYDCQPCCVLTGEHTAGKETDPQLLSDRRKDISKDKAEDVTYNQSAQYVWYKVNTTQSALSFDLAVQSQGQYQAHQVCYNSADNGKLKGEQIRFSNSGILEQIHIVSESYKIISSITFIVCETVNHTSDQRKCIKQKE